MTVVSDRAAEQAAALAAVQQQYAAENDLRARLTEAVAATGDRLRLARDVEVPWAQLQRALGGVNRAAANTRWRAARDRMASTPAATAPPVDAVLSGLAKRWGAMRPLREFQALEVAAEAGANVAGDRERAACTGEAGRRDYEIDGLVDQVRMDAAEAGRRALVRDSRDRAIDILDAWATVSTVAAEFIPPWRAEGDVTHG